MEFKNIVFDNKEDKKAIELYLKGETISDILKEVDMSCDTLYRRIDRYGVKKREDIMDDIETIDKYPKEMVETLINLYEDLRFTVSDIVDYLGINVKNMYEILKHLGIKTRRERGLRVLSKNKRYLKGGIDGWKKTKIKTFISDKPLEVKRTLGDNNISEIKENKKESVNMLNDIYDLTNYDGIGKNTVVKLIEAGLGGYKQLKIDPDMIYILDFNDEELLDYLEDNTMSHRNMGVIRAIREIRNDDIVEVKEEIGFKLPIDEFEDDILIDFKKRWNDNIPFKLEFKTEAQNISKYGKTIGFLNKLERGFSLNEDVVKFIIDTLGFKDLGLLEDKGDDDIVELGTPISIDGNERKMIRELKEKFNRMVDLGAPILYDRIENTTEKDRIKKTIVKLKKGEKISLRDSHSFIDLLDDSLKSFIDDFHEKYTLHDLIFETEFDIFYFDGRTTEHIKRKLNSIIPVDFSGYGFSENHLKRIQDILKRVELNDVDTDDFKFIEETVRKIKAYNKGGVDMEKDVGDFENTGVDEGDKMVFEISKKFDIGRHERNPLLKFKRRFNKLVPLKIDVEDSTLDIDQINEFKKITSNVAKGENICEDDMRFVLFILDIIFQEEDIKDPVEKRPSGGRTPVRRGNGRLLPGRDKERILNKFVEKRNRKRDSIFRGVSAEIEAILEDNVSDVVLLKFVEKLEDITSEKEMDFPVNKSIMFEVLKKRLFKNLRGRR